MIGKVLGNWYLRFLKHYILRLDGAVLPMAAIAFPVILGSVGVGVDFSYWMMERRNLQTAADAAALAGAYEASYGNIDGIEAAALREMSNNGYSADEARQVSISYDQDTGIVDVYASYGSLLWMTKLFVDDIAVAVNAEAEVLIYNSEYCIFSLDPSAAGAIDTSGTVNVDQPDCGMAANSRNPEALRVSGDSDIVIGDVALGGGYAISGSNANFEYASMRTRMPNIRDPYADLEIDPVRDTCSSGQQRTATNVTGSGTIYMTPGTYCGGINIRGNNDVVFAPGVYYIDGGDFNVTGDGSLYGEGVSFVLTNSGGEDYGTYGNLDISGGREVDFSAPAEGEDMEGVVFYQDRNAPPSTQSLNSLTGASEVLLDGVAYFPAQGLTFSGNDTTGASVCTKIIARTVTLAGTPRLDNDCENKATRDIVPVDVRLIL